MNIFENVYQRVVNLAHGDGIERGLPNFENRQVNILSIEQRRILATQLETVGISINRRSKRKKNIVQYKLAHSDKEEVIDNPKIYILVIRVNDKKIAYYHLNLDWNNQTATITDKGYFSSQDRLDYGGTGIISIGFSLIVEWLRLRNFKSVIGRVGSVEIENKNSINSRVNAQDLSSGQTFADRTHFERKSESVSRYPGQRSKIIYAITDIKEN